MKMKKKLYGILAFVLVALCALGFALGFTACSGGGDDENPAENENKDPLIGTWEGNVNFQAARGVIDMSSSADTTIIVDESTFSMSVKNVDILGMTMFEDEDYVAIEDATWVNNGEGSYTATAEITGSVYEMPILLGEDEGKYYISLTTSVGLSVSEMNITATFSDARVYKTSSSTTKPWAAE